MKDLQQSLAAFELTPTQLIIEMRFSFSMTKLSKVCHSCDRCISFSISSHYLEITLFTNMPFNLHQ